MTRMTNARVAGSAFLLYIMLGAPAGMLMARATSAHGIAAKLMGAAQHANDLRVIVVLVLFSSFCALVLGAALYAITREVDPDLARFHCEVREPSADTVDQCQSHRAIHSKDLTTLAR